jgi:electron transport complex protein RnfG
MPSSFYDNALAASCTLVADERLASTPNRVYRATKEGESIGFVVESTAPNGYSGKIHMLTGMLMNGTVTGVRVLDHKETPGLGDKIDIRISDWILSFNGQQVSEQNSALWEVKKDGGQFDQFTGATITPRAVVNQVELTIITAMENSALWAAADNNCDVPAETNDE